MEIYSHENIKMHISFHDIFITKANNLKDFLIFLILTRVICFLFNINNKFKKTIGKYYFLLFQYHIVAS